VGEGDREAWEKKGDKITTKGGEKTTNKFLQKESSAGKKENRSLKERGEKERIIQGPYR